MQKETFLENFKSKESFSLTNLECSSCCQAVTVSDWLPGLDSVLWLDESGRPGPDWLTPAPVLNIVRGKHSGEGGVQWVPASPVTTSCDLQSAASRVESGQGRILSCHPEHEAEQSSVCPCLCKWTESLNLYISCLNSCPWGWEAGGSEVRTRRTQWDPDLDKASVTTSVEAASCDNYHSQNNNCQSNYPMVTVSWQGTLVLYH